MSTKPMDPGLRWVVIVLVGFAALVALGIVGGAVVAGVLICYRVENPPIYWHERQPIVARVNGDDQADVIGWIRAPEKGMSVQVAAFDPATGERLWATGALTKAEHLPLARLAVVEDTVLVADRRGIIRAFFLKTGQPRWTANFGERVDHFCGDDPGFVGVTTTRSRDHKVAISTGQLTPDLTEGCSGVWTDEWGRTATLESHEYYSQEEIPQPSGVSGGILLVDRAAGIAVAIGQRESGMRIPVAAGIILATKRMRWRTQIPVVDPLTVRESPPERPTLSNNRLFAPYEVDDPTSVWRLSCRDALNGQSLWDVVLPRGVDDDPGVVASDRHVFLLSRSSLHILEAATGRYLRTIGPYDMM
jgi:hypothetical protein